MLPEPHFFFWPGRYTCEGFFKSRLSDAIGKTFSVDPTVLVSDLHPGTEDGIQSWYTEPHRQISLDGLNRKKGRLEAHHVKVLRGMNPVSVIPV